MNEQEFTERLEKIHNRFHQEIVSLVHEAQTSNGLSIETTEAVPFADSNKLDDLIDSIALTAGWIYDRLHGWNRISKPKKSLTVKIRRALGYTFP